jgi:hypothetical protein
MKALAAILRIGSTVLYTLSIATALIDLKLIVIRNNYLEARFDWIWIGSGVLSLLLALCAERVRLKAEEDARDEFANFFRKGFEPTDFTPDPGSAPVAGIDKAVDNSARARPGRGEVDVA